MKEQWSAQQAWTWYRAQPWLRGCNFVSSDSRDAFDWLQSDNFEAKKSTTDRELALAAQLGFNSIRIILPYELWRQEHDAFLQHLETYVGLAAGHGISVMMVLANDCCYKKEKFQAPVPGPQKVDWGYHGGVFNSVHVVLEENEVGYNPYLDEPDTFSCYLKMVKEIVTRYAKDERVVLWNILNEPGNSRRNMLVAEPMKELFCATRACDPIQPLTADVWSPDGQEVEELAARLSDVISFHEYRPYPDFVQRIAQLKRWGRPLICTEWMSRTTHSTVKEIFPLLYLERIGCYNWGFVNGKSQMNETTQAAWEIYARQGEACEMDMVSWMHDLYRPSLRPYDPAETNLITRFCRLANDDQLK